MLGRVIGIVVFVGGVGLLAFVFIMALRFFHSPMGALPTGPAHGSTAPATTQLGESALKLLGRIGLLVVMTIVGSMLAGRGVQLYFAATGGKHPGDRAQE
jgi:hypothetical protein